MEDGMMTRKRRRFSIPSDDSCLTKNERFINHRCALYLQRILTRFPRLTLDIVTFLFWLLGPRRVMIDGFVIANAREGEREELVNTLRCSRESFHWRNAIEEFMGSHSAALNHELLLVTMDALQATLDKLSCRHKCDLEKNAARVQELFGLTNDELELCLF